MKTGMSNLTQPQIIDTVKQYLKNNDVCENIKTHLAEFVDRYNIWKISLTLNDVYVGEIFVNADSGSIDIEKSTKIATLNNAVAKAKLQKTLPKVNNKNRFIQSNLNNMVILGESQHALSTLPPQSIDLVFTSPPYYNAKKEYSDYSSYDEYLSLIRSVVKQCNRVLIDGKFFVINVSNVLIPRIDRNHSSTRIALPFDVHQIMIEEGFEFVDDIIWEKPEGAGWASGRGRRFSADRNPMQYKTVPVTEYILVYRKKPCILIDHFIRNNPNKEIVEKSKIPDGYERTNIWKIAPAHDKRHPAVFPEELCRRILKYYSFEGDAVLDPFAGSGTFGKVAYKMKRTPVMCEMDDNYIKLITGDKINYDIRK